MSSPHQFPADVPVSLTCSECDDGTHIESYEQAVAAGWTDIEFAPDLPMANFVGLCPECREAIDDWPISEDDKK